MSNKVGKLVEDFLIASGKVRTALVTHVDATSEALAALAKEAGANVSAATLKEVLLALDAILKHDEQKLEAAELAYVAEQTDDVPVRDERDKRRDDLLTSAVRASGSIENKLGAQGLRRYGLDGTTPRAPRRLIKYVKNAVNLLGAHPQTATNEFGEKFDTEAIKKVLAEKSTALESTMTDVDREEKELKDALGRRNQALESWAPKYQGIAGVTSNAFKTIGRIDLAEDVKPTERTLSGEELEGEPQQEGEEGGDLTGGEPKGSGTAGGK
jgi:hypothetical protein